MTEAVTTVLGAIAGFLAKSAWDLYWQQRQDKKTLQYRKRLDVLEQQLSRFYWPIYIRLQKDNAVWQRILDRNRDAEDLRARIGESIESKVILPNHQETVRVIQENIHLAQADKALEELLLQYVRHVAVYAAMRDAGCKDIDPITLGEPRPDKLFPVVAERTLRLQAEFDQLIGRVRP
ncbi:MAG: hypothetical protein AAF215_23115 [Cyanobacteria bacterium P01_A01_bin.123]